MAQLHLLSLALLLHFDGCGPALRRRRTATTTTMAMTMAALATRATQAWATGSLAVETSTSWPQASRRSRGSGAGPCRTPPRGPRSNATPAWSSGSELRTAAGPKGQEIPAGRHLLPTPPRRSASEAPAKAKRAGGRARRRAPCGRRAATAGPGTAAGARRGGKTLRMGTRRALGRARASPDGRTSGGEPGTSSARAADADRGRRALQARPTGQSVQAAGLRLSTRRSDGVNSGCEGRRRSKPGGEAWSQPDPKIRSGDV